LVNITF
jgi:hypothetical protein